MSQIEPQPCEPAPVSEKIARTPSLGCIADGVHTVSWSAWTEGVDALLPKTDRLVLDKADRQDGEDLLIVDWDASFPAIGSLLTEEYGHYPPRFRTQGFPDAAVLAQLSSIE